MKMKMNFKQILILVVLLVATFLITMSAVAADQKVKMEVILLNNPSNIVHFDLAAEKIKQFNIDNKYNVELQLEGYESEQFKTKIATLMVSNAQPDIFYTWEAGFLKPFVDGGKVYPIGDAINKDSEWKDRFVDGVFGPLTFDGRVYGVPSVKEVCVMFYNKKLFKDAGINSAPKTYEEFLAAIESLQKINVIPISVPLQKAWIGGQLLQQLANGVGGVDLYKKICDGTTKWDDPRFIEAGTLLANLVKNNTFQKGFLGMSNDEGRDLFKNEKAAMYFNGSWEFTPLMAEGVAVTKNIDFFLFPPVKPENSGVNVGSVGKCVSVSSKVKNIDAAVAFVKSLSDKDMEEALAYKGKQIIVTKIKLDESKLDPLTVKLASMQSDIHTLTPWFDRIFGAGEGVEFNNAAVAIMGGKDPEEQMKKLQKFAEDTATR